MHSKHGDKVIYYNRLPVITNCSKLKLDSRGGENLWKYSWSAIVNLFFALLLKNSNFSPKSKISVHESCPRISLSSPVLL